MNIKGYVDDIWEDVASLLAGDPELEMPDRQFVVEHLNKLTGIVARYDEDNIPAILRDKTRSLFKKQAGAFVETVYSKHKDNLFALAGVALIRHSLGYGDCVTPAMKVIRCELPFGFYDMRWSRGICSGVDILNQLLSIALPFLDQDDPLLQLKNLQRDAG